MKIRLTEGMVLQTVQERVSMLVQSKYMQHSEAVLKNPILFGDYRTAKSVSHHIPSTQMADVPINGHKMDFLQCKLCLT